MLTTLFLVVGKSSLLATQILSPPCLRTLRRLVRCHSSSSGTYSAPMRQSFDSCHAQGGRRAVSDALGLSSVHGKAPSATLSISSPAWLVLPPRPGSSAVHPYPGPGRRRVWDMNPMPHRDLFPAHPLDDMLLELNLRAASDAVGPWCAPGGVVAVERSLDESVCWSEGSFPCGRPGRPR